MNQSYGKLLSKHRAIRMNERRKTFIYEQFSNGKITRETAIKDLVSLGVSREEAEDKLGQIQEALDSIS